MVRYPVSLYFRGSPECTKTGSCRRIPSTEHGGPEIRNITLKRIQVQAPKLYLSTLACTKNLGQSV